MPGGSVSFDYAVTNTGEGPAVGDLWFGAQRGGSTVAEGLIRSGSVPAGATVSGSFMQRVPASAPPGDYSYALNIGRFADLAVDSEAFEITVTGAARVASGPEVWTVTDATPWEVSQTQSVAPSSETLPLEFALAAAYPNPFASATTVGFALPEAADVRLAVFDVLGREVALLAEGEYAAGRHTARFEAAGLASGLYLVRMTAGGFAETQRVTLAR
ncbi:MAG: T9SS type A sorting domain-containing protein [Bacteroidota bacterium]